MKKEIKTYEVQCDCCEVSLPEKRNVYINDGSYQSDYVTIGNIDLCFMCAGKIFDMNVSHKLPAEKAEEWIKDARRRLKYDLRMGGPLGVKLDDLVVGMFKEDQETIGETYLNHTDNYREQPTRTFSEEYPKEALRTTGVNEMIPVTSDSLTVPKITTSSLTNLGEL